MTDQNQSFSSAEEELAALGFYAPAGSDQQRAASGSASANASFPAEDALTRAVEQAVHEEEEQKSEPLVSENPVGIDENLNGSSPEQPMGSAEEIQAAIPVQEALPTEEPENPPVMREAPVPAGEEEQLSVRDRALSIVDHLTDLRKRLISSLVAFVIFLILSLFFVDKIYLFLTAPLGMKLTVLGPAEIIHVYFMIGGLAALVPTIPFVMWQLWLFVSPGLTERERRVTLTYIPAVFLVFIVGLLFGRFLVFPSLMRVLYGFSTAYTNYLPTADAYFSFMVRLLVPFGFIFEMPILILFLTRLGIINPMRLTKIRKYAYFFIVLVSFMLTPPEITSHLSLTVPMILLYELSIQISRYAYKKRLRVQQERESA